MLCHNATVQRDNLNPLLKLRDDRELEFKKETHKNQSAPDGTKQLIAKS